jgi:SHS2 domain-containing protein
MKDTTEGFRELEHAADWELEVWAPDMPALLEVAARGMYHLLGMSLAPGPRASRRIVLSAADRESLLVDFLSELLFLSESEGVAFDVIGVALDGVRLDAELSGAPVASQSREIKAVTYHGLQVVEIDRGLTARVVFDV